NGGIGNLSPNSSTPAHEIAHTPGGLADEYTEFRGTNMQYYRPDYNLTQRNDATVAPWADLITDDIALPVSLPNSMGAGMFAGGGYNPGGVYRSTSTSMMRGGFPKLNGISEQVFKFNVCKAQLSQEDQSGYPASTVASQYGQLKNICRTAKPQPGFYYDRSRNGHGFVVEPIANTDLYFTIFYTYKDDGTPEWYTSLSALKNNILNIDMGDDTLQRVIYDYPVSPIGAGNPFSIDTSIGTNILKIDFNNTTATTSETCNDGVTRPDNIALATWQLGSQQDTWCIEPLIAQSSYPSPDFGGTWWAGIDDTGWGLSLSFANDLIVAVVYYFDAEGKPRWVLGTQPGFEVGQEITISMLEHTGFARDEEPIEVSSVVAGTLSLTLNNNNGNVDDGVLNVNVAYQGIEGGTWSRTNIPFQIFTEAH
ncbi:MAG: M64 family metallopeptidase, partial [Proteobacteria bacterium]|nr:M64 family metallopeptidase [Pseudomonadota bacterium]